MGLQKERRVLSCTGRAFAALRWPGLPFHLQWRPTLRAELGGGPHLLATMRTELHERRPALDTELGSLEILKPTACTVHAASLLLQARRDKGNARALALKQQSSDASPSSAHRPMLCTGVDGRK
jgi:hypothetical protein